MQLKVTKSQEFMEAPKEDSLSLFTTKSLIAAAIKKEEKLREQYYETNRIY